MIRFSVYVHRKNGLTDGNRGEYYCEVEAGDYCITIVDRYNRRFSLEEL